MATLARTRGGRKVHDLLFIASDDIGYQSGLLYIGLQQLARMNRQLAHLRLRFWPVFRKRGAASCAERGLYGRGFSFCGRLRAFESRPSWATIDARWSNGGFDAIIYANDGNTGCDGVIRSRNFAPWVNDYVRRWPNTTVAYVDSNDIGGCHSAPPFSRLDLVFSREMAPCDSPCL